MVDGIGLTLVLTDAVLPVKDETVSSALERSITNTCSSDILQKVGLVSGSLSGLDEMVNELLVDTPCIRLSFIFPYKCLALIS